LENCLEGITYCCRRTLRWGCPGAYWLHRGILDLGVESKILTNSSQTFGDDTVTSTSRSAQVTIFCDNFSVEITIARNEESELFGYKKKVFSSIHISESSILHKVNDSPYIKGKLLVREIRKVMARETGVEEIAFYFFS
jgi:hypothetical protein